MKIITNINKQIYMEPIQSIEKPMTLNFAQERTKQFNQSLQYVDIIQSSYFQHFIHPTLDDTVVTLNRECIPSGFTVTDYICNGSESQGDAVHKRITEQKFGCIIDTDFETMLKGEGGSKEEVKKAPMSMLGKVPLGKGLFENLKGEADEDLENKEKMNFEEGPRLQKLEESHKLKGIDQIFKFGISLWKTHQGKRTVPIRKYAFQWCPVSHKFFISHCSKFIYFFMANSTENSKEGDIQRAQWVVLLDSITLNEVRVISLPEEIHILDSTLMHGGERLYIQSDKQEMTLNIKADVAQREWSLSRQQDDHDLSVVQLCFREDERDSAYAAIFQQSNQTFSLIKVRIGDDLDRISKAAPFFNVIDVEAPTKVCYNRSMTQVFLQIHSNQKDTFFSNGKVQHLKTYDNYICQQNSFLYDSIIFGGYNLQSDIIKIIDFSNPKLELTFPNYSEERVNEFDMRMNNGDKSLTVTGIKEPMKARKIIEVHYFNNMDQTLKQSNQIAEITKVKIIFPFVFYCQGKSTIIIQSVFMPEKLYRYHLNQRMILSLKLIDFLLFTDMNGCGYDGPDQFPKLKEHQYVTYLTEKGGKAMINVLQYNSFGRDHDFQLYRRLLTSNLDISDCNQLSATLIGNISMISKSDILIQKSTEMKTENYDFIYIMQYDNEIKIQSFITPLKDLFKNIYRNIHYIKVCETTHDSDQIYFIQQDGLSVNIVKLQFDKDQTKDANEGQREWYSLSCNFKSEIVYFFKYHRRNFYLLDDNYELKQYKVNPVNFSMEEGETFVLRQKDIEDFINSGSIDFEAHDVEITDTTMYWKDKAIIFREQVLQGKDKDFFDSVSIFGAGFDTANIEKGPFKIRNPDYNVYFIRNHRIPEEYMDEASELVAAPNIEYSKMQDSSSVSKLAESSANKFKIMQKHIATESSQEYDQTGGQRVLFTIPIDQYFIQFFHLQEWKTQKVQEKYPKIEFNTFVMIDEKEFILVKVEFRFMLFNKYGDFLCNIDFKDMQGQSLGMNYLKNANDAFIAMSDNMQYLLFQIIKEEGGSFSSCYQVFELKKEKKDKYYLKMYSDMKLVNECISDMKFGNEEVVVGGKSKEGGSQVTELSGGKQKKKKINYLGGQFNKMMVGNTGVVYCVKLLGNEILYFENEVETRFDLKGKFSSLLSKINEEDDNCGCVIQGDYLFVKKAREIFYIKVFNTQGTPKVQKLDLDLDEGMKINFIFATGRSDLITIVINKHDEQLTFVISWDLVQNMEYSQEQIKYKGELDPSFKIVRGVEPKLNYYVSDNYFFDFQFNFPMRFIESFSSDKQQIKQMNMWRNQNGRNISKDCSIYLDIYQKNTIINSFTNLTLCYFEQLDSIYQKNADDVKASMIMLEYFRARYKDLTMFHLFQDERIIQILLKDVQNTEGNDEQLNKNKEILLNILYPNKSCDSSFDLAIAKNSIKIVDLYVQILIQLDAVKHYRFSKYIRHHFDTMFEMDIVSFYQYLDTCTFQHLNMHRTYEVEWTSTEEEIYLDYHTSFLGDTFLKKFKRVEDDKGKASSAKILQDPNAALSAELKEEGSVVEGSRPSLIMQKIAKKVEIDRSKYEPIGKTQEKLGNSKKEDPLFHDYVQNIIEKREKYQMNQYDNDQDVEEVHTGSKVELLALEFEWIFRGDFAKDFIQELANSDNDELFAIKTIKIIIQFLWDRFFWGIFKKIFMPFLIYVLVFNFYVTFIFQTYREVKEGRQYDLHHFNFNASLWQGLDLGFLIISLVCVLFFCFIELRQLQYGILEYFASFWNCIDILSLTMNLTFIICDLANAPTRQMRPLGSACVLILWVKLFYFMRLFNPTASFIRMIMQIIIDIFAFAIAFICAVFAFGQCFFILAQNHYVIDDNSTLFTGMNFMHSLIYSYQTGLGSFSTSTYNTDFAGQFEWFVFFLDTILIQIILLNLIIGLMGDTYEAVAELGEMTKFKELCSMISENEFVLNRNKVFQKSRYIIIARLEKATKEEEEIGKHLKEHFKKMMLYAKNERKLHNDLMKSELQAGLRECTYKLESTLKQFQTNLNKLKQKYGKK